MGNCLPSFSQRNKKAVESQFAPEEDEEYEDELDVSDDEEQKSDGQNQYNQWVRSRLLKKWSDEADERRESGLPAKEIGEERLVEMLMFGLASK